MPEGPRRDPKVSTRIRKWPLREHDEMPTIARLAAGTTTIDDAGESLELTNIPHEFHPSSRFL